MANMSVFAPLWEPSSSSPRSIDSSASTDQQYQEWVKPFKRNKSEKVKSALTAVAIIRIEALPIAVICECHFDGTPTTILAKINHKRSKLQQAMHLQKLSPEGNLER